jgi:hypothetical protein
MVPPLSIAQTERSSSAGSKQHFRHIRLVTPRVAFFLNFAQTSTGATPLRQQWVRPASFVHSFSAPLPENCERIAEVHLRHHPIEWNTLARIERHAGCANASGERTDIL